MGERGEPSGAEEPFSSEYMFRKQEVDLRTFHRNTYFRHIVNFKEPSASVHSIFAQLKRMQLLANLGRIILRRVVVGGRSSGLSFFFFSE